MYIITILLLLLLRITQSKQQFIVSDEAECGVFHTCGGDATLEKKTERLHSDYMQIHTHIYICTWPKRYYFVDINNNTHVCPENTIYIWHDIQQ